MAGCGRVSSIHNLPQRILGVGQYSAIQQHSKGKRASQQLKVIVEYYYFQIIIVVVGSPRLFNSAAEALQLFLKTCVTLRQNPDTRIRVICCCGSVLTPKPFIPLRVCLQISKKRQSKTLLFQKTDAPLRPFGRVLL